mgnify:FL=1
MEIDFNDFDVQDDIIKTGNGNCGYMMFPNLCGCNPGPNGGYEYCNKKNCPLKNND